MTDVIAGDEKVRQQTLDLTRKAEETVSKLILDAAKQVDEVAQQIENA